MAKATSLLLSWLAFFVGSSLAIDAGCDFSQNLTPGITFSVNNTEYPYPYLGQRSCRWTMNSDYRVNLNCTTFQLPWSFNCALDRLSVQVSSTTTHQYCGDRSFIVESEGPTMTVTLTSPALSIGGRFLCEAVAIKRPQDNENCQCSWKNPTRIAGGTTTGKISFSYRTDIVQVGSRPCGSMVISDRYLLSAALCVEGRYIKDLSVRIRNRDLTTGSETNAAVFHQVSEVHIHPNYDAKLRLNDIAVVKTVDDIQFGDHVSPVCLPFQHSRDNFAGDIVSALGWKATDFGDASRTTLQEVQLNVLTNQQCSEYYQNVSNDQLCTYPAGNASCQMDSGEPILWENPTTGRLVLVGINSYGDVCGKSAAVNTRVGAFLDWITSVTPDASYCRIE